MAKKKSIKRKVKKTKIGEHNVDNIQEEEKINISSNEIINEKPNSVVQPVLLKLCRLCESKDGPFVEMFDSHILSKKIDDIMPFVVTENDNLPQKICFRCSAKVEEVYEFIQKCIKTQESFQKAVGVKVVLKRKQHSYRSVWEDNLNKHSKSNDDVCNALIQKAIAGIKNLPMNLLDKSEKYNGISNTKIPQKPLKDTIETFNQEEPKPSIAIQGNTKKNDSQHYEKTSESPSEEEQIQTNTFTLDSDTPCKPFNIMDHVSMIKVNGVGVLFQCKLCNRNFLVKEVVLSHRCAKNGGIKIAEEEKTVAPSIPKVPLIKYINTKPQTERKPPKTKINELSCIIVNNTPINVDDDDIPLVQHKPKRKIGPASKTRQLECTPSQTAIRYQSQQSHQIFSSATASVVPSVQTPDSVLNANSRYKLLPGPHNSIVLVEDKPEDVPIPLSNNPDAIDNLDNLQTVKNIPRSYSRTTRKKTNINQPCPTEQPYPVRLIKSGVACNSDLLTSSKKQSYTIVQTGNPSKLLISTKTQPADEVPTKKLKETPMENSLFDSSDNSHKSFITFVNVDPTAQPSYVLPTGNIIQESQISTSTIKTGESIDKYPCDICGKKFSREKKLQSHIQSHYNDLDKEDQRRASIKKRKL